MKAKPKAAFLDFASLGPDITTAELDRLVDCAYYAKSSPAEISPRIADREIAIVNKAVLGREAIASAVNLRLIVVAATGTDNVDASAADERGIAVANVRDYCSAAVAQHVWAMVLELTQKVSAYHGLVLDGAWQRGDAFALFDYPIRELAGRSLGIVGYGTLGRAVASFGRCLGMELVVAAVPGSTSRADTPPREPLRSVLERCDVVSLHCPLTEHTRSLIGAEELAAMKSDAILINTARGGLVDGAALAEALRRGEIAGAGIDVLPTEPPDSDEPLLAGDIPNLLVTPHIAWAAREARQRAVAQIAENVEAFLAGDCLRRVV
jgi:glycerate dehydrogenase